MHLRAPTTCILVALFAFVLLSAGSARGAEQLEAVSDDDLVHMIKSEDYVIVLFSKKNCDDCDRYETQLINLQADFKETLEANVVRAHHSQLAKLYSPTREPALVFFRHGVPLLYDGAIDEDAIFQLFENTKQPVVKELSDENFEHLTQASTGSTTGDWFVQFYTSNCIECQRLSAVWEAVGAALKSRMNVARINRDAMGTATAQRFRITASPEFVLIRHGKFYRYEAAVYDVKAFVSFAHEFYKNSKAEKILVPPSPFDDLVMQSVQYIRQASDLGRTLHAEQPHVVYAVGGAALAALLLVWLACKCRRTVDKKQAKKAK